LRIGLRGGESLDLGHFVLPLESGAIAVCQRIGSPARRIKKRMAARCRPR
jgi:hypothetical protein